MIAKELRYIERCYTEKINAIRVLSTWCNNCYRPVKQSNGIHPRNGLVLVEFSVLELIETDQWNGLRAFAPETVHYTVEVFQYLHW